MKSLWKGAIAKPLQRGVVQGYDFNRMVVEFTTLNEGNAILCAISTANTIVALAETTYIATKNRTTKTAT